MRIRLATWAAMAMVSTALPNNTPSRSDASAAVAASEVYIQQSRGPADSCRHYTYFD
jgi:hypothetical protein